MTKKTVEFEPSAKSRVLSVMSYLGILCLVPMMLNKDDEFVNFHARQGLILWIWSVVAIFSLYIPGIGDFFFSVSALIILVYSILGIVSVVLSKAWKFPFVGGLSENI